LNDRVTARPLGWLMECSSIFDTINLQTMFGDLHGIKNLNRSKAVLFHYWKGPFMIKFILVEHLRWDHTVMRPCPSYFNRPLDHIRLASHSTQLKIRPTRRKMRIRLP
jgi:hypothetical protein